MSDKILLLQSYLGRREPPVFPLALAVIASALPSRYELRGFDPNVAAEPWEELRSTLRSYRPSLVLVSLRNVDTTTYYHPHLYHLAFRDTVNLVKEVCPDSILIAGGAGFSLFARQFMRECREIDLGVYLEGEETLPRLLENLDHPERVGGVYCREAGGIRFTGPPVLSSLSDPPRPAWEIFGLEPYRRFPFSVGVETKRGCVFKCAYCSYFKLNGEEFRLKPPERVVGEIAELRDRFGIREISFVDSIFNVPEEHAVAILRLMKRETPDVDWIGYLSERGMSEPFVEAALATGLKAFVFSPDAYTDRCLGLLGKGITVADIRHAVEVVRKTPADLGFNFFVNGPGYTYGTLWRLLGFILRTKLKLGRRFRILKMNLGYIRIEPGTPLQLSLLAAGKLQPDSNLLPRTRREFKSCFYLNRSLFLFNLLFISLNAAVRLPGRLLRRMYSVDASKAPPGEIEYD